MHSQFCSIDLYIYPYANTTFYIFLPNCLGQTTNTMLNRCSKREHPCLVLEFGGKEFNLSSLIMMLHVGFCRCPL